MHRLAPVLIFLSGNAIATTCLSTILLDAEDPLSKAIEMSDVIFIGEVVERIKTVSRARAHEEGILDVKSLFEVKEVLKGKATDQVLLMAKDPCDCRYDFEPGVEYIVLATVSEGHLVPKFCKLIATSDSVLTNEIRQRLP